MKTKDKKLGKVSLTVDGNYHSLEKEYDKLVIVEEKDAFVTYVSRKPVPMGIQLTNRDYWIPLGGMKESIVLNYNEFKAEFLRQEAARVLAEDERRSYENSRRIEESIRIEHENTREENENTREENENTRKSNENVRQQQEGSPDNEPSSTGSRWSRYKQAESNRNSTFNQNETNRNSIFLEEESSRSSAFANSQSAKQQAFETSELNRQNTFETNESSRNTTFENSESSRNTIFETSESNRNTTFNQSQAAKQQAYEESEGSSNDQPSENGSRWARYKQSELDRNATIVPLVGVYKCNTAANVSEKVVDIQNYILTNGGAIKIKFDNTNTTQLPTLNINSTGAKAIIFNGSPANENNSWKDGEVVEFYYDVSYNSNSGAFIGRSTVVSASQNESTGKTTIKIGDSSYDVATKPVSVSQSTLSIDGNYAGEMSTTYDVTLHNNGATFASLEALLSDANLNTLIPQEVRKGGMSIKFVRSSDNKYVQYLLINQNWSIALSNWRLYNVSTIYTIKGLSGTGTVPQDIEIGKYYINASYNTGTDFVRKKTSATSSVAVNLYKGDILVFDEKVYIYDGELFSKDADRRKLSSFEGITFVNKSVSGTGQIINTNNARYLSDYILTQNLQISLNEGYYLYVYLYDKDKNFLKAFEDNNTSLYINNPIPMYARISFMHTDKTSDIHSLEGVVNSFNGLYDVDTYEYCDTIAETKQDLVSVENELIEGFDSSSFSVESGNRMNTTETYTDVECYDNARYSGLKVYTNTLKHQVSGNVYYFAVSCKANYDGYIGIGKKSNSIPYYGNSFMRVVKASDNYFRLSERITLNTFETIHLFYSPISSCVTGDVCSFLNPIVLNLTEIFGVGNEPPTEYVDTWLKDVIIPINGKVLLPKLNISNIQKDEVVIAGSNVNTNNAVKCTGYCDEYVINHYVNDSDIRTIKFVKGSIFNLAGAISIVNKQNKVIDGNGCNFFMEDATELTITEFRKAANNVDWIIVYDISNFEASKNFINGQYVEIYNPDATQNDHTSHASAFILLSSETKTQFRLSPPLDSWNIEQYVLKIGAKMKNVSSIFDVRFSSNIIIKNVKCDLNVANNSRSNDTFMAQNGIHFYKCNQCKALDGEFINGGRHGILISSSPNCDVKNCYLSVWGEHCIDLAFHNSADGVQIDYKLNAIVDSCICTGASMLGIQLHRGSNCKVINNYCYENSQSGIGLLQGAKNNIIANNHCYSNNTNGILGYMEINNCLFVNNILEQNGRNGIELEDDCTFNIIDGNISKNHNWNGFRIISGSKNVICNNHSENDVLDSESNHVFGIQVKNSTLCYCHDNFIIKGNASNMTYAVGESDSSDKNVFKNNIGVDVDSISLTGQSSISDGNVKMNT